MSHGFRSFSPRFYPFVIGSGLFPKVVCPLRMWSPFPCRVTDTLLSCHSYDSPREFYFSGGFAPSFPAGKLIVLKPGAAMAPTDPPPPWSKCYFRTPFTDLFSPVTLFWGSLSPTLHQTKPMAYMPSVQQKESRLTLQRLFLWSPFRVRTNPTLIIGQPTMREATFPSTWCGDQSPFASFGCRLSDVSHCRLGTDARSFPTHAKAAFLKEFPRFSFSPLS